MSSTGWLRDGGVRRGVFHYFVQAKALCGVPLRGDGFTKAQLWGRKHTRCKRCLKIYGKAS